MTEQSEMTASLLRQRRNLIIVSLIIVFILYTNVQISKISIFSIEFMTPKPESIMNALWVIWGYFLVRYYQYLMVEPAIGIKKEFYKSFEISGRNKMLNKFIADYPECKLTTGDFSIYLIRKKSFLSWELPICIYEPAEGKKVEIDRVNVSLRLLMPAIIKSAWHVFMHTPRVTDYAFPFILAFSTITFGLIRSICA